MYDNCLINGEYLDGIAISDRGLHYGDGLFETLAVCNGVCEFWDAHVDRLLRGCARLRIPPPSADDLLADARQLTETMERGVLKIILTRGSGGRGYRPPAAANPTRLLMTTAWPDHRASNSRDGVAVRLCDTRLGASPALAGIKHLNRLEQVLARMEWNDDDVPEGLMCDTAGHVIEGTFSNVFLVKDGRLRTPVLDQCGVAGIMRGIVMRLARDAGHPCETGTVEMDDLFDADEIFLTNSLIGIWPVRRLGDWQRMPGDLTRQLQALVEQARGSERQS